MIYLLQIQTSGVYRTQWGHTRGQSDDAIVLASGTETEMVQLKATYEVEPEVTIYMSI